MCVQTHVHTCQEYVHASVVCACVCVSVSLCVCVGYETAHLVA